MNGWGEEQRLVAASGQVFEPITTLAPSARCSPFSGQLRFQFVPTVDVGL